MTFSDRRIVEFVSQHFVPVWESVAPVSTATFELGDGRSLKGTIGGEIAIFFCLPDGRTYDILPALQSPNVTFKAIQEALALYRRVRQEPEKRITAHHAAAIRGVPEPQRPKNKETLSQRLKDEDAGTRAVTTMSASKSGIMHGGERTVVVEPAGLAYYKYGIHYVLARPPLRTPQDLRKPIFEGVLEMKLESRDEVFMPDSSPEPFMFVEDDDE